MFWTRLLSSIVLVIIVAAALVLGKYTTGALMLFLALVGSYELLRVYKLERSRFGFFSYLATIVYYLVLIFSPERAELPIMLIYLLVCLAIYVLSYPSYKDKDMMAAFLSFFYVSVMLAFVYKIRVLPGGGRLVPLVFICAWGNDTLAYATGMLIGKHKMSPKLSPKKSIEGLIGGIVGAGLLGIIYAFILEKSGYSIPNIYLIFFITGLVGAVPAVIGDLAASAIKRDNDIKDYGKLIPGHGGVMDRFDSMIFVAPIIYYLMINAIEMGI